AGRARASGPGSYSRRRSRRGRGSEAVAGGDELLEQRAVALDLHALQAAPDDEVEEPRGVPLDGDVGVVDRPALECAVDDGGSLVSDAELEAAGRRHRSEHDVDRVREPAGDEIPLRRRAERASAPER